MMKLIYLLAPLNLCTEQAVIDITYLVGLVVFGIKVAVPIILIVVGMTNLLGAISQQDEKALKKAQEALVQKAVAAVAVFLIATIVGLLMGVIGGTQYQDCMDCINSPFSKCNPSFNSK